MSQAKPHIIAAIGSLVSMVLVLLLLYFLSVDVPVRVEDEGIEISFGDMDDGGGRPDMDPIMPQPQDEALPAPPAQTRPSSNDLMVQEDEEDLLVLAKQREEEARRKAEEEEFIRKQREEEARIEAERYAREQALAEKQAQKQEAIARAQQAMAGFGQTASAVGANGDNTATTDAAGVKGNPVGKGFGSMNGNTWTLYGRDNKELPLPSLDSIAPGKVTVNIIVNEAGDVVSASIGEGSDVGGLSIQQAALDAARRAKFTKGDKPQRGQIVYIFKTN